MKHFAPLAFSAKKIKQIQKTCGGSDGSGKGSARRARMRVSSARRSRLRVGSTRRSRLRVGSTRRSRLRFGSARRSRLRACRTTAGADGQGCSGRALGSQRNHPKTVLADLLNRRENTEDCHSQAISLRAEIP